MYHLNISSGGPKVKITLEDQIFVLTITSTVEDGFQNNLTQLFSIMCRFAIRNDSSGRQKVKVTLACLRKGANSGNYHFLLFPTFFYHFQNKLILLSASALDLDQILLFGKE